MIKVLVFLTRIFCLSLAMILTSSIQAQVTAADETDVYLEIRCICIAEWNFDGTKLAVVAWPDIQIWNSVNWELEVTITEAYPPEIEWHPTENLLAAVRGGEAEGISVWDATTGERTHYFERLRQPEAPSVVMHALAWSPEGDRIVTDSDGVDTLLMWDLNTDDNPQVFVPRRTLHHNAFGLTWSPDGHYIVSGGADERLPRGERLTSHIWDSATGRLLRTFAGHSPFDWAPDSSQFVGVTRDNVIAIWDVETFDIVASFDGHYEGVISLSWNFNEGLIASSDSIDNLIIWDIEGDDSIRITDLPISVLSSVDWQPNSQLLAVAGRDGVVIRNIDISD